jgi:transcription antitermination factor NusG
MFPAGQRVEIVEGTFAGTVGVVISELEAQQRNASDPAFPMSANAVRVVLTFWGHECPVVLTTDVIQAVA